MQKLKGTAAQTNTRAAQDTYSNTDSLTFTWPIAV